MGSAMRALIAWRFQPTPSLPSHAPPRDQADADRQDLADLGLLMQLDRSFDPDARRAFEDGRAALASQAGSLSRAAVWMGISRLVALAGNGHTRLAKGQLASQFGHASLSFAFFADGLYVVRAATPFEDLLGTRVLAIDERPVEAAFADVRPYVSGTPEHARAQAPSILRSPPLLKAVWPDTDGRTLRLRLETGSGRPIERSLAGSDGARSEAELGAWPSVIARQPKGPCSLVEPERVVLTRALQDGGLYIRLSSTLDDANGPLDHQLAQVLAQAPATGWRRVVLDLRFNAGGDYTKTVDFTRDLPRHIAADGRLWLLVGNDTFSAGIVTLARAKYFAGDRARIVGERVGDRDRFWAERGQSLRLRNSGIVVDYATALHDWVNGCRSPARCFWLNFFHGVAAGDLAPETVIGWRFADFAAGRDTLLDWVKEQT
jgi:hypothetical protein